MSNHNKNYIIYSFLLFILIFILFGVIRFFLTGQMNQLIDWENILLIIIGAVVFHLGSKAEDT